MFLTGARVVLLWCMAEQAAVILRQAERLGMTGAGWAWLITDGTTVFVSIASPLAHQGKQDFSAGAAQLSQ